MGFLQLGRLEQLKGEALAVSAPKGCGRGLPQRNEAVSHPGSQRVSLAERGQKGHGREKELAWIVFKFLSRSFKLCLPGQMTLGWGRGLACVCVGVLYQQKQEPPRKRGLSDGLQGHSHC